MEGGIAVVELAEEAVAGGRSDEVLAYAQLVATLDAFPEVKAVQFVRDGEPLPVPAGDGVLTRRPVSLADYRQQLAGNTVGR